MLRYVKAAVVWSTIALGLAGCTNLQGDLPNWLKGLMVGAFFLAVISAGIAIFSRQSDQRITAVLIAFILVILGVLFLFMLIA